MRQAILCLTFSFGAFVATLAQLHAEVGTKGIKGDEENWDVYVVKTDAEGNLTWERTYGGAGKDSGLSIEETHDGGYILCGWTSSFDVPGGAAYLVRTDTTGNLIWQNGVKDPNQTPQGKITCPLTGELVCGDRCPLQEKAGEKAMALPHNGGR